MKTTTPSIKHISKKGTNVPGSPSTYGRATKVECNEKRRAVFLLGFLNEKAENASYEKFYMCMIISFK